MRIAAAGAGRAKMLREREAESAVPQMRTRELGKGMARRIDSEVREDGVTATGDGTKMVQPDGL